jgi:hypothetical protein
MKLNYLPTSEQDERVHAARQRDQRGLKFTIFYSDTQSVLKLVERQARRLRSAEAQVADRRLALDQEIAIVIDTTPATLSEVARAARLSPEATDGAIKRTEARGERRNRSELREHTQ